jgi:hypothetical protein
MVKKQHLTYKKYFTNLIRNTKKSFNVNLINTADNRTKTAWSIINNSRGKLQKIHDRR